MAELTGRKVLTITVSAFAVIIGVNVLLAWKAVETFPGLEVQNSYVASQTWDAERAAQRELGWSMTTDYDEAAGELRLSFVGPDGRPAAVQGLSVLVGRPTEARDDQWPRLTLNNGVFRAPLALAPGKWMLKVEAMAASGTMFRQRIDLLVEG
jgi:nitrogen fixation protein FixH